MRYEEILSYMYRQLPMYQRQGKSALKKDLSNITALCDFLDNPQKRLKIIHVAGTNGKGSSSHIIASILQEYGFQVGLYTSPHYSDFRERIKINGNFISKEFVIDFVEDVKKQVKSIQPSFFEITVAMAFKYFAMQKVDFAVIETGLGGRLDSTNIVQPLLSVITNIGFDHMDMLGDTIPKIAFEKAGIIKASVPALIGEDNIETTPVFEKKARDVGAPLLYAKNIVNEKSIAYYSKVSDNNAPFFKKNLKTALAAIKILIDADYLPKPTKELENGVRKTRENTFYIGRWEVIQTNPLTIADSAHNVDGFKYVLEQLSRETYDKLHIILGFVKDKEINKILASFPKDAIYYFTNANISRALPGKVLKVLGEENGLKGRSYISVKNAISAALKKAKPSDLLYMGGSIFIVGEVLDYFKISNRS